MDRYAGFVSLLKGMPMFDWFANDSIFITTEACVFLVFAKDRDIDLKKSEPSKLDVNIAHLIHFPALSWTSAEILQIQRVEETKDIKWVDKTDFTD